MSRPMDASNAWIASRMPAAFSASVTSASSCLSSQVMTSPIERFELAAAKNIGASSFAAVAYQKSASDIPCLLTELPSASHAAVLRAPVQLKHPARGVHDEPSR